MDRSLIVAKAALIDSDNSSCTLRTLVTIAASRWGVWCECPSPLTGWTSVVTRRPIENEACACELKSCDLERLSVLIGVDF